MLRLVSKDGVIVDGMARQTRFLSDQKGEDALSAALSDLLPQLEPSGALRLELSTLLARLEHRRAARESQALQR